MDINCVSLYSQEKTNINACPQCRRNGRKVSADAETANHSGSRVIIASPYRSIKICVELSEKYAIITVKISYIFQVLR